MEYLINKKQFNDLLLLEKFINGDLSNDDFILNLYLLNEKLTLSTFIDKLKITFDWIIKNIRKIGKKIVTITKGFLNLGKKILTPNIFKVVVLIFIVLMTQASFANFEGETKTTKQTEITITINKINESKSILNSAIGFLSLINNLDSDKTQAIAILTSIRDNMSPNDLNNKTYDDVSNDVKKLITATITIIKNEVKDAIDNQDEKTADLLLKYKDIGEKLSSTFSISKNYSFVKIVDDNGKVVNQWQQRIIR